MRKKRKICLLAIVFCIAFCSACGFDSKCSREFFAMDTVMSITAYGDGCEKAVNMAEREINRLDRLLSIEKSSSEVLLLNKEKQLELSNDTLKLVSRAREASIITEGAFDITTEPLTRAWGFYSELDNRVPSKQEIQDALRSVGFQHINISGNTVALDESTSIDLGGIAKGYASAKAADILKKNGVTSALISLGGNVRTVGKKPDGSFWTVGIADPDDSSKQIGMVSVSDSAVVTSGGYQRFFEEKGHIYHHIINPKTGYPADSGLKSVTVISSDDTLADALSTALFVMGLDKSSELYSKNPELFSAVLVTEDNNIYITENLKNSFSSERNFEVIFD